MRQDATGPGPAHLATPARWPGIRSEMESYCFENSGAFLFSRPVYTDNSARPSGLEFGLLRTHEGLSAPMAGLPAAAHSFKMEPMVGIEPTTYGLRNRCSTTELHWLAD